MPTGKRISEEVMAEGLRLRAQGLTPKVIAIRTRLHWKTIYRLVKEGEKALLLV